MKHPLNTLLYGDKVVLTSYKPEHVPKYHDWMGDEDILRLTGSERLTLEEEYEMQLDWENDPKKCTFIILARDLFDNETKSEIPAMIGDTNLFLNIDPEDENSAEIEVMIAEKSHRRKGCAREALQLIMDYSKRNLNIKKFLAKIKSDNAASIKLFNDLGFLFLSKNDVFDEVCLVWEDESSKKNCTNNEDETI